MPNIQRTYPQPDSPEPQIGPRERAMAVYKYLCNLEPEDAVKHELFPVIEHAFLQSYRRGLDEGQGTNLELVPSLIPIRTSSMPFELG